MKSSIKNQLKWRYRVEHFLSLTEKGKEALWQGATFIFALVVISYFVAHWLLWLTGYYNQQLAIIIH